ncbi:MAG: hypothetical protein COU31_02675 [Candidatus Magasanikbacteria bacterium CG10_big_fil_rev_8_21_14_0_10_40_10]|uniref:Uncharacterized protein n=1 Tax=Candidatus Magasanikbacteria bacterium CG10_big_fil_rev_8_21_14_0_10_40_10 TaxID=1974648 RepID=A0A2M6W3S6_9BACT|nr:MAG: hypothetical protein COU31_02675 [Candidatus Magasanikbacteria bacterium CG10_big_fil_rev_8_21_14_0_10_40_10]
MTKPEMSHAGRENQKNQDKKLKKPSWLGRVRDRMVNLFTSDHQPSTAKLEQAVQANDATKATGEMINIGDQVSHDTQDILNDEDLIEISEQEAKEIEQLKKEEKEIAREFVRELTDKNLNKINETEEIELTDEDLLEMSDAITEPEIQPVPKKDTSDLALADTQLAPNITQPIPPIERKISTLDNHLDAGGDIPSGTYDKNGEGEFEIDIEPPKSDSEILAEIDRQTNLMHSALYRSKKNIKTAITEMPTGKLKTKYQKKFAELASRLDDIKDQLFSVTSDRLPSLATANEKLRRQILALAKELKPVAIENADTVPLNILPFTKKTYPGNNDFNSRQTILEADLDKTMTMPLQRLRDTTLPLSRLSLDRNDDADQTEAEKIKLTKVDLSKAKIKTSKISSSIESPSTPIPEISEAEWEREKILRPLINNVERNILEMKKFRITADTKHYQAPESIKNRYNLMENRLIYILGYLKDLQNYVNSSSPTEEKKQLAMKKISDIKIEVKNLEDKTYDLMEEIEEKNIDPNSQKSKQKRDIAKNKENIKYNLTNFPDWKYIDAKGIGIKPEELKETDAPDEETLLDKIRQLLKKKEVDRFRLELKLAQLGYEPDGETPIKLRNKETNQKTELRTNLANKIAREVIKESYLKNTDSIGSSEEAIYEYAKNMPADEKKRVSARYRQKYLYERFLIDKDLQKIEELAEELEDLKLEEEKTKIIPNKTIPGKKSTRKAA